MLPYTTILAVLLGITNAKPLAMPQGLDFGVVDDLPPPPSVSIAVGVASQVVTVNEASAVASVAALATNSPLTDALDGVVIPPAGVGIVSSAALLKRAANATTCTGGTPQPTGSGPVSTPDTPAGFQANAAYGSAASSAATPSGFTKSFTNLNGATSAYAYLGFTSLSAYNPTTCASQCNTMVGCQAFNICKSPLLPKVSCLRFV